jgi:hypothetical protein
MIHPLMILQQPHPTSLHQYLIHNFLPLLPHLLHLPVPSSHTLLPHSQLLPHVTLSLSAKLHIHSHPLSHLPLPPKSNLLSRHLKTFSPEDMERFLFEGLYQLVSLLTIFFFFLFFCLIHNHSGEQMRST